LTAQGHPRTIFRRAIERGNVVIAEMAAREVGTLELSEALDLLCLYAAAKDAKFERAAVKSLGRFIEECSPSLLRAQIALAAFSQLRAGSEPAETLLREFSPRLRCAASAHFKSQPRCSLALRSTMKPRRYT
jgi:hypothetical protein